ncbi:hypothetical protein OIU84_027617 [Salix udensis]|uniref:EF-hand domain-containing protein n=1 Tax=Salix udensis TaxID=889485 RepID=A0AAD6PAL1_9ROSI|nr:hypothetical protein OIU84_027617 [Salix udensis]
MEEIRRAAGAYYEHLPEKDKNLAGKTFKAMDKNGDEQISLREYMKRSCQERTSAAVNVSSELMHRAPMKFAVIAMVVRGSHTTVVPPSVITILCYVKAGARYKRPP